MILIKSFLTGVAYDCFKIIQQYLNEGDKVLECYSCLKMMVQAYLQVCFFLLFSVARGSLKRFYLYIKLLQSSTIFKQKNNHGNHNHNHNFYNYQFKKHNCNSTYSTTEKMKFSIKDFFSKC